MIIFVPLTGLALTERLRSSNNIIKIRKETDGRRDVRRIQNPVLRQAIESVEPSDPHV